MWKPRLASFALCALSLFLIWQLPTLRLTYGHYLIPFLGIAGAGVFCGFSGIVASFMATPSSDTYFVPADNAFIRILEKIKIIDLSKNMGFCEYSIRVGGSVFSALFLMFFVGLIGYSFFENPVAVIWDLSIFIGLMGCYFGFLLLVKKFPKILPLFVILLALFVCFKMYISPPRLTYDTDGLLVLALTIGICSALLYMRHLLTKTRIYARFCPQYSKTESTS